VGFNEDICRKLEVMTDFKDNSRWSESRYNGAANQQAVVINNISAEP
jgi:hypothetical protein